LASRCSWGAEVVVLVEVFDEPRVEQLPADQPAGQRAGGGDVGGEDHPERAEVLGGLLIRFAGEDVRRLYYWSPDQPRDQGVHG
jgi:hypothetical protein